VNQTVIIILLLSFVSAKAQQDQTTIHLPAAQPGLKEDWSSPSLDKSHLSIGEVLEGGADEYDTFTREVISLTWRAGDPVYLYLILPKNHPKPSVILYLYSYPTDINRFQNDKFCEFLAKNGFAAAGFVSALTGHRYHDRPMKEWFISELQESLASSAHDVQMVLNYLATRGDLDMNRVGMYGEGSGGAIAIMAAAVDPRIKVLDLADPWGDWPEWLAKSSVVPDEERPAYAKPEFLDRVKPLDPINWLPKLKIPVRVEYFGEPGATPLELQAKMLGAAPSQAKVIAHKDALEQYRVAKLKFFDWMKDQLTRIPVQ